MKIAVLGTGMVGNALATKLVQVGHEVIMGSRTADSDAGRRWVQSVAGKGKIGTFADAAGFGELILSVRVARMQSPRCGRRAKQICAAKF